MHTRSNLTRVVALALLLYSLGLFSSSLKKLSEAEEDVERRQLRLEELRQENMALKLRLEKLRNGEGMEALARERLGLVLPGEKIFYFTSGEAEAKDIPG